MRRRPIYTLAMAKHLTDRGFEAVKVMPNKTNLKRLVWLFERTPELEAACEEYIADSKRNNQDANATTAPKASKWLLTKMHLEQGLPVEAIAQITHKTEEEVRAAIDAQVDLFRLFAIAAMNDAELRQYMSVMTEDERNELVIGRMRRGGYTAYGGKTVYEFPAGDTAGEVREDA